MAARRGYGERRRRAPFGRGRERGQRGIGTEGETRESGERCKGSRGVRGTLGCLQRRAGKQEVAGALGRAPRLASAYWQRKTTSGEVGGLGWSSWAAAGLPGKYSLSVFPISVFIYLFCSVLF